MWKLIYFLLWACWLAHGADDTYEEASLALPLNNEVDGAMALPWACAHFLQFSSVDWSQLLGVFE